MSFKQSKVLLIAIAFFLFSNRAPLNACTIFNSTEGGRTWSETMRTSVGTMPTSNLWKPTRIITGL